MWFKDCFRIPILDGSKRSTIRKSTRLPKVGQIIALQIGARPPFAWAVVTHIAPVTAMSDQKKRELASCFKPVPAIDDLRVVRFRVVDVVAPKTTPKTSPPPTPGQQILPGL